MGGHACQVSDGLYHESSRTEEHLKLCESRCSHVECRASVSLGPAPHASLVHVGPVSVARSRRRRGLGAASGASRGAEVRPTQGVLLRALVFVPLEPASEGGVCGSFLNPLFPRSRLLGSSPQPAEPMLLQDFPFFLSKSHALPVCLALWRLCPGPP